MNYHTIGLSASTGTFISQDLTLSFDPLNQTATGLALIKLKIPQTGYALFQLDNPILEAELGNDNVVISSLSDPDGTGLSMKSPRLFSSIYFRRRRGPSTPDL